MLARVLAPRLGIAAAAAAALLPRRRVRYQEERPGRLREYYEIGAELLGAPGDDADEEMLELFLRVLPSCAAASRCGWCSASPARSTTAARVPRREGRATLAARDRAARAAGGAAGGRALLRVVEDGAPAAAADLGDDGGGRGSSACAR